MLYFIYTYKETRGRTCMQKTVRLYRVKKNVPVYLGELSDTYVSEFQLVLMCLQSLKALPASAFETNANTGGFKYSTAYCLREAKIADVRRVS